MAIYKLFPEKDATLYTQNITMNTGLDEILEASTYILDDAAQSSRYLIKFATPEINGTFDTYVSSSTKSTNYINYLNGNLFSSITDNPTNLATSMANQIFPITASTGNGIGGKLQIFLTGNTIAGTVIPTSRETRGKNYKPGDIIKIGGLTTTAGGLTTASFTLTAGNFIPRTWNSNLKNYAAVVTNLNSTSYLKVYPISQSWDMGTGRFGNSPITENGCCWRSTGEQQWTNGTFNNLTTGSYSQNQGTSIGGGTWYTGSSTLKDIVQTQTFTYANSIDLNVDVTNTIDIWISQSKGITGGDIPNEGFIIKQTSSVEFIPSQSQASTFKFYSVDTNTIYPPQLDFKFDDFFYHTSSKMEELYQPEAFISSYNNDGTYYSESVQRFRIAAVPQYPKKVFQTQSGYLTNYYLPQASYYAIKDSETNEYVIEFDSIYTQVSADTTSSYFDIYMGGLEPERYYTILLKTTIDGTTKVFDEDIMFKVING
tara:strand:- start:3397 stop:4851 length:1455 start_codon:yes stop_codon:yes gene_type:complete